MLQGTSLARLVTVTDLIGVAKRINAMRYIPFEADITAGRFAPWPDDDDGGAVPLSGQALALSCANRFPGRLR